MASDMLINALKTVNGYLHQNYSNSELKINKNEIDAIIGESLNVDDSTNKFYSYEEMQKCYLP